MELASRVELTTNPMSPGARAPALIVTIVAYNAGASAAFIHDISATFCPLSQNGSPAIVFRSLFEILRSEISLGATLAPPSLATFQSFSIGPSSQVVKSILLVPLDAESFVAFRPGPAEITARVLVNNEGLVWAKTSGAIIDVEQSDLDVLGQITATPQLDGRNYINWFTQSKAARGIERALKDLQRDAT